MKKQWIGGLLGLLLSCVLHASIDVYEFEDVSQETQYRELVAELRCPKCQNQNLADSNAPLAKDIKNLVYTKVSEGQSDEEIIEFMVARYGDFIRYDPPLQTNTFLLWGLPVVLLFIMFMVIVGLVRRQTLEGTAELKQKPSKEEMNQLLSLYDAPAGEENQPSSGGPST